MSRRLGVIALAIAAGAAGASVAAVASLEQSPPPPAVAPLIEAHYAPAENLEKIDVALIDAAVRRVDMAAYLLTDFAIIEALIDAGGRGVEVRVWRDRDSAGFTNPSEEDRLEAAANVQVRVKAPGDPMHLSSFAVDGVVLRSGSANFSPYGEMAQDNDLVVIRDRAVAARFEADFERMWSGS